MTHRSDKHHRASMKNTSPSAENMFHNYQWKMLTTAMDDGEKCMDIDTGEKCMDIYDVYF